MTRLSTTDNKFLKDCINLSAQSLDDVTLTPFGAIVVVDGEEVGRGISSVQKLHDPTAHAEILALQNAGKTLQNHLMPEATMYCSGEPCPMCLVACWWAGIDRIITAATIQDSAVAGFEDTYFFSELQLPPLERKTQVVFADNDIRNQATQVLIEWKNNFEQRNSA